MKSQTILQLDEADLDQVLERKLAGLTEKSVLARFEDRLVSADTAAEILDVHRDTLIGYARAGIIECQHSGKLWKFQLSYILTVNMHDIKKRRA